MTCFLGDLRNVLTGVLTVLAVLGRALNTNCPAFTSNSTLVLPLMLSWPDVLAGILAGVFEVLYDEL